MARPAMLQINTAGAWRHVCEFDIDDGAATSNVMEAGATLGTYGLNKPKVRIVKLDAGYPVPLMRWSAEGDWQPQVRHDEGDTP